jgi:hypothetical protein
MDDKQKHVFRGLRYRCNKCRWLVTRNHVYEMLMETEMFLFYDPVLAQMCHFLFMTCC